MPDGLSIVNDDPVHGSGIYGESKAIIDGIGVIGVDDATGGTGVYGHGDIGVWGVGQARGVAAFADGSQGSGVYARGDGAGGQSVWADNLNGGTAVLATTVKGGTAVDAQSDSYIGVLGRSDSGFGVVGYGANTVGVWALGGDGKNNPAFVAGAALFGPPSPGYVVASFVGDVVINGAVHVTGAKGAAVALRDGSHRALYCVESPESWFEDFGRARLIRGKASVRLDRTFAQVVRTGDYHVFLSPEGLSHGLYVSRQTRGGFEVREQHKGTSTVRFSYRIVARRKDIDVTRFKRLKLPVLPKAPRLPKLKTMSRPAPPRRPAVPKARRRGTKRS